MLEHRGRRLLQGHTAPYPWCTTERQQGAEGAGGWAQVAAARQAAGRAGASYTGSVARHGCTCMGWLPQALPTCSCGANARPKRPCCASRPSMSSVKKVGRHTPAPAPSMGSSAEVSGKSSSGPAAAAAAGSGAAVSAVSAGASAAAGAGRGGGGGGATDGTLAPQTAALASPWACCDCCACQPRRATLRTAASDGSWYWQLQGRGEAIAAWLGARAGAYLASQATQAVRCRRIAPGATPAAAHAAPHAA